MAREVINVGAAPNDGQGDPIRTSFIKTNNNFGELYARAQENPPATLVGTIGDEPGMYAYDSEYFYYCFADYDGSTLIWSQIGNAAVTSISSGNTNISIPSPNGNITLTVGGQANVGVMSTNRFTLAADLLPAGNALYDLGSAAQQWRSLYVSNNSIWLGGTQLTVGAGNVLQVQGANVVTFSAGDAISVGGNITGGNLLTPGIVSATGNVVCQSGIFIGNGAGLTGVVAVGNVGAATQVTNGSSEINILGSGGNIVANVAGVTNIVTITTTGMAVAGNVSATSNITGGNLLTSGLISSTGNITGGNLLTDIVSATGNVQAANLRSTNSVFASGNIIGDIGKFSQISATGNVLGSNLITAGLITASGNITGNYFIGNGSQLTGIDTTQIQNGTSNVKIASSNGNVTISVNGVSALASFTDTGFAVNGTASITGNITAGNTSATNHIGTTVSVSGNVTGGNIITSGLLTATGNISTAGLITATGNVTGSNLITGGLVTATGNITSGNLITAGLITAVGNITAGNLSVNTGTVSLGSIVNNNANGVGNIGTTGTRFNTVFALASSAQYADLAEYYLADQSYPAGTVVAFGGPQELTICDRDHDATVAGIISDRPAFEMNAGITGDNPVALALAGRVCCRVTGPIRRGQMLVSAGNGHARAETAPAMGTVIGKALEDFNGATGTIEVVVGRL